MLAILSPSKTMQTSNADLDLATLPQLAKESVQLARIIKKMSRTELQTLMSLSPKLSEATSEKFGQFGLKGHSPNDTLAIHAYQGEVYTGLDATSFGQDDLMYAQDHLRILSGLYGVLRPLDIIQQYRLEMATRLETKLGTNLYQYWGDKISNAIQSDIKASESEYLLNLASDEYSKCLKLPKVTYKVVQVDFFDLKNGKKTFISFNAKKARGLLANYMIKNQCQSPAQLHSFDAEGYQLEDTKGDCHLVYVRK